MAKRLRAAAGWARTHLFAGPWDALVTLALAALLAAALPPLLRWALWQAQWSGDAAGCRAAGGACWAFIGEKARFILFGLYPPAEQWRAALAVGLFLAMAGYSAARFRLPAAGWALTAAACGGLLAGGVAGLPAVPATQWGGLPLTLLLTVLGLAGAFPLALLLALGRRSRLPVLRALCAGYVELVRGVPLVSVLFMASVMLPLLLPGGVVIDKLVRAQLAIVLFVAAYMAEAVRGGLQAVPEGQDEAASALGLRWWQRQRYVVLPQALRVALPALVGIAIGTFKDTSLVVVIGLFDLMTSARAALADPRWLGFSAEAYLFTGTLYFVLAYALSRYGRALEARLAAGEGE
ncbi:amino acid ABC transporter membrane protein 2 (PAAT family) [Plasticicumulans lactativorans]|uniref:Amino acid ABC transporter membrane protein 2 (PAAT family) n=1 Tax=Plasticicumulans lactativorans TaxID=1133106 RepID=A0A4R2KXE8_9GAMM|nr:amino acid ABC transporter permease [Plasticicumulans lactativorans]TCO79271.1 amino acid ABC transporter membrane protein 2 (PAAT family) [Plasticicumulans lactativorans]